MDCRLYSELTPWYHLIDPPEDHGEEAEAYAAALVAHINGPAATLLELGAGAGHNACHMKRRFRCTLTDLSAPMQARSRALNADCEHALGDMRTLRLERTFDAVLVHDAVAYMTTEADLSAAVRTAFVHTRPGGAALFAPDHTAETFRESSELLSGDDEHRSLRCLAWTWDPDPGDSTYTVDYAFLLREDDRVRAVHDRHIEGLFTQATWRRVIEEAGFEVATGRRPVDGVTTGETDLVFVGRRSSD